MPIPSARSGICAWTSENARSRPSSYEHWRNLPPPLRVIPLAMRRILLALLLVALAVSTADARRRHYGFYGYGNDGDRSERYGERSERYGERGEQYRARRERSDDRSQRYGDQGERYGRGEPAFGQRYGRARRD